MHKQIFFKFVLALSFIAGLGAADAQAAASLSVQNPTLIKCIELLSTPPNPAMSEITLNLTEVVKAEMISQFTKNALQNAWLDGYMHYLALKTNLAAETREAKELATFFEDFSFEFEEAIHADPYLTVFYLKDRVSGTKPHSSQREAHFAYDFQNIKWENGVDASLIHIQYHAHSFYYVFTKTPESLFKTSIKRWDYLNAVDFQRFGSSFTDTRYGRKYSLRPISSGATEKLFALYREGGNQSRWFCKPEDSICVSPRALINNLELHNSLLTDPE